MNKYLKMQGEAAANYLGDQAKIINSGGHTEKQLFNVDETALLWKMLSRTFIAREEKSMLQNFKGQEDSLVRG